MPHSVTYSILCFLSLILLTAVGFGPALYLISRQHHERVLTAILIAPALALAEIGLVAYPLFLNSIPLDRVYMPLTVLPLVVSLILIIIDFHAYSGEHKRLLSKGNGKYLAGFILIFLV